MEIAHKLVKLLACLFIASCAPNQKMEHSISHVYIEDFQTENMNECKPSDVDLNNEEAKQFFLRSTKVEYKTVHDHYNVAPCYIEGTLKTNNNICDWKIQASAIGSISCRGLVNYYVCDSCEDLFN